MQVEFHIMLVHSSTRRFRYAFSSASWILSFTHSFSKDLLGSYCLLSHIRDAAKSIYWAKQIQFLPSWSFQTKWGARDWTNTLTQINIPLSIHCDKSYEITGTVRDCTGKRCDWDHKVWGGFWSPKGLGVSKGDWGTPVRENSLRRCLSNENSFASL